MKTVSTHLPAEGFVRRPTVLGVFGMTKSTLYNWISQGLFPAPKKLGPRLAVWDVQDLRAHMEKVRRGVA